MPLISRGQEVHMAGWRDDILEELKEQGVIDVESIGILTGDDIRSAMKAINDCELARDEAKELEHIKKLQQDRAVHMYGS